MPQTQNPDAVWLGWNTQDPGVVSAIDRGATMRIGSVSGPGRTWMFLQDGTFGKPRLLVDGQSGQAQDVWVDASTHVHANWVFTAPGVYTAALTFSARTTDGQQLSASTTGTSANEARMPAGSSADGTGLSDQVMLIIALVVAASITVALGAVLIMRSRSIAAERRKAIAEADGAEGMDGAAGANAAGGNDRAAGAAGADRTDGPDGAGGADGGPAPASSTGERTSAPASSKEGLR